MDKVTAMICGKILPKLIGERPYIQRWWVPENVRVRSGDKNKRTN